MNAQTILNAITVEKNKFLAQYEDKAYFKKKSSVFFTDFLSRGEDIGILGSSLAVANGCLASLVSLFFNAHITNLFHINIFLSAIFAAPVTMFIALATLKITVNSVLKWKYNRRKNNDIISELFSKDFYNSEASPEIKNMLKLLLSEDQYFKLREGKAQITYKDAKAAIDSIIERESVMEEQHEVFLSPEEIKKYSYVNAG